MSKPISQEDYDETGFLDVPVVRDAYFFKLLEVTNRARRMRGEDFNKFSEAMGRMNRDNIDKWSERVDEILCSINSEYEKGSNYETNTYNNDHPDLGKSIYRK